MIFTLPDLPYTYGALQPYMSSTTLEFHHEKHHQAYVNNLNRLLPESSLEGQSLVNIVKKSYMNFPDLFNNAGQHYNHSLFWNWMKKDGGGTAIPANLQKGIDRDLGGYEQFRTKFIDAGTNQFGSGWCWLEVKDGIFSISQTPNGENPLIHGAVPLLGCDVWEHSYYLDYRNLRKKYLEVFFDHLINWEYVEELYSTSGTET
ncbi:MAG: superoxide dismutase [Alphaproteobacteria bacterium]|nr:superoxide dismutase [Alphaproteobacteria bacterium]